ncbi:MAG: lipase maturation factor family protein, partial [Patescibacteria group bacterium]
MIDILGDIDWTKWIFQRGLGAVYLIAFLVTANQFRALIGERGLNPATSRAARERFWRSPSIFHFWNGDRFMAALAWVGIILAAAATLGISDAFGTPVSMLIWFLLWVIYLSFVNVGGTFYGFGWESMTLEAGFLAIFLGASGTEAPEIIMWMVRWMLFRVMFGAGMIKLRGDRCWRDLTCLQYHHETQPIPGPFSWYFHHLPKWMHKMEVLGNHFVELVVPFFYFAPAPYSYAAGIITIIFHAWLIVSGNFSWLNWFTIVLAIPLFDDAFFQAVLALPPLEAVSRTLPHNLALGGLTILIGLLSIRPLFNLFSRFQIMNTSFDPFHLVNTYGAVGRLPKTRY